MEEKEREFKTPDYTRRASAKYAAGKDRVMLLLPLGTIERLKQYGTPGAVAREMVLAALEERERGAGAGGDTSDPFMYSGGDDDIELPFA